MSGGSRRVVVTGASSGIGLGLVRAFLERGDRVVATSRHVDGGALEREGVPPSDRLVLVRGDVGARDTAERVVAAAAERFGGVDVLVNNAGIFVSRPFTAYTPSELQALLGTNVHGFFHLTQLVVRGMMERGGGSIVTITASIAEQPMASMPAVLPILTKAGLNAATRALALELAPHGIRVNAVSPGAVRTRLNANAPEELLASLQPLGRPGQVGDVVDAVLYLTGATYVTGEILHVDGGMTAGRW